jgi:hypothetical protein
MASQKTDQKKERDWRKKVRKFSELMFRGNDQERETARQRLDELLTKNRMGRCQSPDRAFARQSGNHEE